MVMECQVSSTYHQKENNKGKRKNKATFLKIYTVLDFTHEPETIHLETFLWIFLGRISNLQPKTAIEIKLPTGSCLCGTVLELRGNFGVLLITRGESQQQPLPQALITAFLN